jgi:hypothetical protein
MPLILIMLTLSVFCTPVTAQKKWAGPATGNWDDTQNWLPQGVPTISDDVSLDNSLQKSDYSVAILKSVVSINSLTIEPAAGKKIEVLISGADINSPAFIIHDGGNSFNIKEGGTFQNASALLGGQSIQTAGMITIYNGGRYVHRSRSSHATEIVAHLAMSPGTEKGVFEFDVPGGSYPVSISNRSFGTLVLSSLASGGSQTYNASGSNTASIHGDLQINEGVQFNLDLTTDMVIYGDYIQKGGVFNLASQSNNNVVRIKGDISQLPNGVLTESAGGLPVLELGGSVKQLISLQGNFTNSVALRINNGSGAALTASVTLPFKLELVNGTLKTTRTNLLTLAGNCTVAASSVVSFVDGPLRKQGHDDFEFPLGKQGDYAPLMVTGAGGASTDEFTSEYFLGDPAGVYGFAFESPPVVRISQHEYWVLERTAGSSPKKISLSIGNNSNATDLQHLVVVRWEKAEDRWRSEGNSAYTGIATGTVVSNDLNGYGVFTLASTVLVQNPLELRPVSTQRYVPPGGTVRLFQLSRNGYLSIQSYFDGDVRIVIADAKGMLVTVLKATLSKGMNTVPVPATRFARGVYICSLYDLKGRYLEVQRIICL